MNLGILIQIINKKLSSSRSVPELKVVNGLIISTLKSSVAERIFGCFWGGSVYRWTKNMEPFATIKTDEKGSYLNGLQFYGNDYFDDTGKRSCLRRLNDTLAQLDYSKYRVIPVDDLIDFSDIEKIQFKI